MCGTYKPTRVISVSYGVSEYDAPVNYTRRQCNEFLKLGLQGHTVFYASGDYGVASFPGDDSDSGCLSAPGMNQTIYNPSFPTCPYVTDVGATRLYDDQTVLDPESAMQANLGPGAELFASAGGFANYFPVPSYQTAAIDNYFKYHDPGLPYYIANDQATNIGAGGGIYNRAGRGFPDVSANGADFRAYNNGTDYHWYGTSLSSPIWASIMTLINEERTVVGKGPVGFINPSLYANTWVFNDIVNGSNPGCGSEGFSAVEGWDPVTGLGTPKYPKLLELFLSLP
jgi:tripeptidyl-peptidase-1